MSHSFNVSWWYRGLHERSSKLLKGDYMGDYMGQYCRGHLGGLLGA